MKKLTFILFILLKFTLAKGQEWVKGKCDTTAWVQIDTLKKYSDSAGWVPSEWSYIIHPTPDSSHRYWRREEQFRIGKTSGYLMRRERTTEYILRPKQKSVYEIIIDSVSK